MKLPYVVILTIISLLLTILQNYKDPTVLYSETRCAINSLCVVCPQLQHSVATYPLKKYTRVSHNQKFYVLSTSNYLIAKSECRNVLQLVQKDQKGALVLTKQFRKQLQNGNFKFQAAEQVTLATGTQYHAIISEIDDYLIFYETNSYRSPSIYVQNKSNPEKLMKISRSIAWGMFFALILKYLDSYIGIFNVVEQYPFPYIEFLIVSYLIYISYELSTFSYIYVAELMFLVYLLINLIKTSEILKIFGIFIVLVILGESYLFLASLLWLLYMKKMNSNFFNQNLKTKIASIIVIIGLISELLVLLSKFNFLIYLDYAYKVISIPVSFMMFQIKQEIGTQPKNREINLSRYMGQ